MGPHVPCSLIITLVHVTQDGQDVIVLSRWTIAPSSRLVRMVLLAHPLSTTTHVPVWKGGWVTTVHWRSMIVMYTHPVRMVRLAICSLTITHAVVCQVTLIATVRHSLIIVLPVLVRMRPLAPTL